MTEEELKKYEATAHHGLGLSLKTPDALSLIRLARVGLAVTPRPISEAPKDGRTILAVVPGHAWSTRQWVAAEDKEGWFIDPETFADEADFLEAFRDTHYHPLFFIPLSALPKPGGDAPSKHHDWQISDSSLYDFKCRNCGSTDRSKDADLPCPKPGGE